MDNKDKETARRPAEGAAYSSWADAPAASRRGAASKDKKKYKRRRFMALALLLVVLLAVSWGVTSLLEKKIGPLPLTLSSSSAASAGSGAPLLVDDIDPSAWNFIGPVQQTINNTELITPDYRMIALPANGRVDVSYFDSVTFVGDSITQGMPAHLPSATYCAYKGVGPKQIYDGSQLTRPDGEKEIAMDALAASQPENVYILLGTNALVSYSDDAFIEYYAEMLRVMREALLPGVRLYMQTITPVRPDTNYKVDNARVQTVNDRLAKLAYETGCYFIDLNEALAGEDGYLREDLSQPDGLHLNPDGYAAWVEYLVTHTAYHPLNPYLPGSPYGEPV